uniref:peptidoglycan DD-metalloendopeptidase family protein n=1 Tax=Agathobacter sp. TaxID=2021311 RepID=UPI00405605CF
MKKYSYIVAVACIMVGVLGFTGIYAVERSQQKQEELAKEQQKDIQEQSKQQNMQNDLPQEMAKDTQSEQKLAENSQKTSKEETAKAEPEPKIAQEQQAEEEPAASVENVPEETLHFNPAEDGIVWPVEGAVLLDYSKDATIYFPTLQQYQYNPAMVIAGEVNSKVYFAAKGKITNIETNEVTGCTVTQDIGDGYTIKYGQLKELNFEVGDTVESGQVVGYVSEPTKYYSVEGPNVYFQVLKDNEPIDPQELLDKAAS